MSSTKITTEALRKKFKNNFNLCNFAIQIGRNMVLGDTAVTLTQILEAVDEQAVEGQAALTRQEAENQ